jgi:cytochrome c-type biogenesis protein CcmH/NrfG
MKTDNTSMEAFFDTRPCLKKAEVKAYVNGSLPQEKRMAIENHLLDCPLCDTAIEGYRLQSQQYQKTALSPRTLLIVAILILLGILLFAYLFWPKPTTEHLFQAYYQTPQPTLQRDNENAEKAIIISAFNNKDYQSALQQITTDLKEKEDDQELLYIGGIAALEMNQSTLAVRYLQKAIDLQGRYTDQATWYLGLLYVQNDELEKATATLQSLSDSADEDLRNKSLALLQKISGMK